ncbi:DUF3376 domain-containing protein [Paractinoplanes maris]|uniref:DUF3376 domain-containing protein n=1 Tax=Paractinoplanes maris TaxID=1734446 RepID=UPI002021CFC8|nr:DUF3376 domain-containing protein [Actinoplanes maris]
MTESAAELRFALVLNGGVSLAVWMGGVTHELDLLRRAAGATDDEISGVREADRPLWRRWRTAAGNRRVVIDVIAGSSAGGINGALLATAIARGTGLDPATSAEPALRGVWERAASLQTGKLVARDTKAYPASVLDGDFFQTEIGKAIDDIRPGNRRAQPVTLFLTATALGPADVSYADAEGHPFIVADHRRLYRFEADPERVRFVSPRKPFERCPADDFTEYAESLKRSTRATASFPVAFSAVPEVDEMCDRLQARPAPGRKPGFVADGGIIDNAPFDPVLDRITRRPANTVFDRYLLYIVPSRGNAAIQTPLQQQEASKASAADLAPDWPRVVQAAVSLPRESDFRSDIEALDTLLRTGDTTSADAQTMFQDLIAAPGGADGLLTAADALLPAYRKGRLAGGIWDVQVGAGAQEPRVLRNYGENCEKLTDRDVEELGPRWIDPGATSVHSVTDGQWRWGLTPAERCLRLMSRDLQRRMRGGENSVIHAAAGELAGSLRRLEALRDHVDRCVAHLGAGEVSTPATAVKAVNVILGEIEVERTVGALMAEAAEAYARVTDRPGSPLVAAFAVEVLARALNARAPFQRTAPFTFLRVGPDAEAPVLDDPDLLATTPDDLAGFKLYGTRAWHFAAFGKAEWRRWDWLWGRLDAVTHLAGPLGLDESTVRAMQEEILRSEGVSREYLVETLKKLRTVTDDRAFLRTVAEEEGGLETIQALTDKILDVLAGTTQPQPLGRAGRVTSAVLRSKYRRLPNSPFYRYRSLRLLLHASIRRRIWSWTKPPSTR